MGEVTPSRPCRSCGGPIYAEHRYCPGCGTRILTPTRAERAEVVREFASGALRSAEQTAWHLMRKDPVKKVAGGAALGIGVAAIVPLVPLSAGAALGAAYVGYKMLTKD